MNEKLKTFTKDWNGWKFNVVCGKFHNDWFMAIPNWKVCVECAPPYNVNYNAEKIEKALKLEGIGMELASEFEKIEE